MEHKRNRTYRLEHGVDATEDHTMTKEEFWAQLETLMHEDEEKVPQLILTACDEHLTIPMVMNSSPRNVRSPRNSLLLGRSAVSHASIKTKFGNYAYCNTGWTPSGPMAETATILETDLEGLLEDLKDMGYDGICFVYKTGAAGDIEFHGFDWADFRM